MNTSWFDAILDPRTLITGLITSVLGGCLGTGCSTPDGNKQLLERGKARGHLAVTTDGRVGGAVTSGFYLGPEKSILSFDGDVDYGNQVPPSDWVQPADSGVADELPGLESFDASTRKPNSDPGHRLPI